MLVTGQWSTTSMPFALLYTTAISPISFVQVGKDFVKKGQNKDQVAFAISATSKSLYARMFDWVVGLVNDSLDTPNPRKQFIGKENLVLCLSHTVEHG